MKKFESKRVILNTSSQNVYDFIGDLSNLKAFMPEQVTNWQSTADTCSFTVKNMTTLNLRINERVPFERIDVIPDGKPPFDFKLQLLLFPQTESQSEAIFLISADLNPIFSMMASKPLQNLVDLMAKNMEKHFS